MLKYRKACGCSPSDVCFFYVCRFFSNLKSLFSYLSFQSDRLPPLHLELIPYAPYGEDVFGVGWVFFYGFADAVDVYGDGGGVAQGFHAPDAVVQGVTAEYDACVDHEKMKQLKFFIGQFHRFALYGDGVGGFIHGDAAQGEGTGMFLFPAAFELFIPGKAGI